MYCTDIQLSGTGQDHFGAFQLIDQLNPNICVGLNGGAVLAAFKVALAGRVIHHKYLLKLKYAEARQDRSHILLF